MQTQNGGRFKLKPLIAFASKFGGELGLNSKFVVKKSQRYFLLNPALQKVIVRSDFYYAGLYLGKIKDDVFFPSFNFLNMLTPLVANKIVLEKRAAWLFVCGRDVFRKGIAKWMGSQRKGEYALVMNEFGECLGFGKIVESFNQAEEKVAVENILDVGDFLRREI